MCKSQCMCTKDKLSLNDLPSGLPPGLHEVSPGSFMYIPPGHQGPLAQEVTIDCKQWAVEQKKRNNGTNIIPRKTN